MVAFQDSGVSVYFGAEELLASFAFQMLEILPGESNCTFQALTGLAEVFLRRILICAPDPQSLTSCWVTESTPPVGAGVGLEVGEGVGEGDGDATGFGQVQPVPQPPGMLAFFGAGGTDVWREGSKL
jgi:hypothetical protein